VRKLLPFLTLTFYLLLFTSVSAQHVQVENWYDDEKHQIKEVYYVLAKNRSVLDSFYSTYYQNGNLKAKGFYIKNRATGPWEYYFENGNLRSRGELKDNQTVGVWEYFYENGGISMAGELVKGQKENEWKFYYENGEVKSTGSYEKGKKQGLWTYFNEDGSFKAQAEFTDDQGMYREFYPSGKLKSEGEISGNRSIGLWKYYYEDGTLKGEGEEKDGLKEGYWKYYYQNGKIASEGKYVHGVEDGPWKYYHENGQLSAVGEHKEGQKEGYWKLYYSNGAFKADGNFKNGDGLYKEYYESGKLKVEGNVKKGKNEGPWKYYYESGAKEGEAVYEEGKGNYVGYYENGNLKMEGRIEDGNKVGIWKLYKDDGTLAGYYKTYYENDVPVFEPIEPLAKDSTVDSTQKPITELPPSKIPKKIPRNYKKKVNEYQDYILGIQPLGLFRDQLPISLEYYIQERLGFEVNFTFYRSPLLGRHSSLPHGIEYTQGFSSYLRQKLYQRDKDYGMIYWAQEIRYTFIDHYVNTNDYGLLNNRESVYSASIIFGDRLLKDAKKRGWTADLFGGIGIGYREIKKNYQSSVLKDAYFSSLNTSKIAFPIIRIGVSVGYLF
jgi:antitoxin component YwqK of YwqJK toxin-antitoxin module